MRTKANTCATITSEKMISTCRRGFSLEYSGPRFDAAEQARKCGEGSSTITRDKAFFEMGTGHKTLTSHAKQRQNFPKDADWSFYWQVKALVYCNLITQRSS